jgi:hypothetical protein
MRRRSSRLTAVIFAALVVVAVSLSGQAPSRASSVPPSTTSPYTITPGVPWADTSGNVIQGHNGSIIQGQGPDASTYYWIGDDIRGGSRLNAACYSSTDLVHWTFQGDVLPGNGVKDLSVDPNWKSPPVPSPDVPAVYLLGPVKVIYVPAHGTTAAKYVLWAGVSIKRFTDGNKNPDPRPAPYFLLDDAYNDGGNPCDPYTWVKQTPFYAPGGAPSGDIGIFKDSNGTGYLISEDQAGKGPGNCVVLTDPTCFQQPGSGCCIRIYQMQGPDDETLVQTPVTDALPDCEAPAMFEDTSTSPPTYYLIASRKTGWPPNVNIYASTTSLSNWTSSTWNTLAASGGQGAANAAGPCPNLTANDKTNTCDSQSFGVLQVNGTSTGTKYVYLGDRWDSTDLGDSGYVWLHLNVDTKTSALSIDCTTVNWSINTSTADMQTLDPAEFGPYLTFTNPINNTVMEIASYNQKAGTAVDQAASNGRTDQQWQLVSEPTVVGSGNSATPVYEIENLNSGMVLQAMQNGPGPIDQEPMQTSPGPLNSQEWDFVSLKDPPTTGTQYLTLQNLAAPGDVISLPQNPADGDPLALAPAASPSSPDPHQEWALSEAPGLWGYTYEGNVDNEVGTPWFGSLAGTGISDVAGMAVTKDGGGYWLVESTTGSNPTGEVTSFGDAAPKIPNITLNTACPAIEGVVTDPAAGFWAFDACGDVYAEAGATAQPEQACPAPATVAGMAAALPSQANPHGGYWQVCSDGTVLSFGDASTSNLTQVPTSSSCPIQGAVSDPAGGFWAYDACGNVTAEAGATYYGEKTGDSVISMAAAPDGQGYWLIGAATGSLLQVRYYPVYHFGDATEIAGDEIPQNSFGVALRGVASDPNM